MPYVPFHTLAGPRAFDEMRTVIILGEQGLPKGPYGFLELYCDEHDCDCRRVMFHVVRPDSGTKVFATIGFGWEPESHYRAWAKCPEVQDMADQMAGASLELLGPQTELSNLLLDVFREHLEPDPDYVDRLKRHYAEMRAFVAAGQGTAASMKRRARSVKRRPRR